MIPTDLEIFLHIKLSVIYFTKVPKRGTLSQYQLVLHLVFSPLRQKCCRFYL